VWKSTKLSSVGIGIRESSYIGLNATDDWKSSRLCCAVLRYAVQICRQAHKTDVGKGRLRCTLVVERLTKLRDRL